VAVNDEVSTGGGSDQVTLRQLDRRKVQTRSLHTALKESERSRLA